MVQVAELWRGVRDYVNLHASKATSVPPAKPIFKVRQSPTAISLSWLSRTSTKTGWRTSLLNGLGNTTDTRLRHIANVVGQVDLLRGLGRQPVAAFVFFGATMALYPNQFNGVLL